MGARGVLIAAVAALVAPTPASAELTVRNAITFTRPDGSAVAFPHNVRVRCGRWERRVRGRTLHGRVGARSKGPFWQLRALVGDVRRDPVVELPNSFVWNQPEGADLFVVDGENELSSAVEEATGRIVVDRVRCGRRLAVRFHVQGALGSEFSDGDPLAMRGSFSARR
jgi:hypothetical protein